MQILANLLGKNWQETKNIALYLNQDAPVICAILGVLKAGKSYIPIDTNYPTIRVKNILKDCHASLIITDNSNFAYLKNLNLDNLSIINIDDLISQEISLSDSCSCQIKADDIAYIIYTSGSTGKPKGVVQNHGNVWHFIRNYTNFLSISKEDKLTLLASYCFDAAVIDIFTALLNGATLCIYDLNSQGLINLLQWLNQEKITVYHSTPTVYRYLMQEIKSRDDYSLLEKIRLIVLGGEEVTKQDFKLYQQYFADHCIFVNGYGSTESSFNCLNLMDKKTDLDVEKCPLGNPLENTEILLFDESGKETTANSGEIAIKSPHVALGYWQQPELTKQVFFASEEPEKFIYLTGDLGYRRIDGKIELLGRKDFQVKIRGIRIELGEIEYCLNQHPDIQQSSVVIKENPQGERYLSAYVRENRTVKLSSERITEYLRQRLPYYMIPQTIVFLDTFPLTLNGKIDRQALVKLDYDNNREEKLIVPRNQTEIELANIYQEVLGIQNISIHHNFFDLGGTSLLATQIISRVYQIFNRKISLRNFFAIPTIEQLGEYLMTLDWMEKDFTDIVNDAYEEIEI